MFKVGKHQNVYSRFLNLFTNKKILLGLLAIAIVAILIPTISFATEVMDAEGETLPEKVENAINEIITEAPVAAPAVPSEDMSNYLCFEPAEPGASATFQFGPYSSTPRKIINKVEYSDNQGVSWKELALNTDISIMGPVYIRSSNPNGFSTSAFDYYFFRINRDNKIKANGSVMSLLDNGEGTKYSNSNIPNCFFNLFGKCDGLITPPELPASKISYGCYQWMFSYCSNLQYAPELPALEVYESSYDSMFYDCSSIETVPSLPATKLDSWCYSSMFEGCKKVKTSPEIPALEVYEGSCYAMFSGCTSLEYPPVLRATKLGILCYEFMFSGCENLKTAPELPALEVYESSYNCMFSGCTSLEYPPVLRATKLGISCYEGMFGGCENLKTAPELPATTLAPKCYIRMFQQCQALTSTPYLPAESLVEECYKEMFKDCTSLKEVSVGFTSWNEDNQCTNGWLQGVPNNRDCTFVCPKVLAPETSLRDDSHVPSNWQIKYRVSAKVEGYNKVYDGQEHGLTITPQDPAEITKEYSWDGSSWSAEPITEKNVGEYEVYYRLSAENYVSVEGSAMIIITPKTDAEASFDGAPYSKMYGDKDPEFKIKFQGLAGGDKPKLYEDYAIIRETGEDVTADGAYYKVMFSWLNPNYTIAPMETTMTIAKTNKFKLVCDDVSKVSYEDDPSFTAHMEGLKFDDELLSTDYDIDTISSNANPNVITLRPKFSDSVSDRIKNNYVTNDTSCFINGTYKIYEDSAKSEFQFMVDTYDSYYDGQYHKFAINVKNPASGASVQYKKEGDVEWKDDPYSFKDVGVYNIDYKITHEGFSELQDAATLTIQKAPATVVPNACSKNEGEADPALTAKVYGLVEGESLTPREDYILQRQPGEAPGMYDIYCMPADSEAANNYELTGADSKFFIAGQGVNAENVEGASGAKTSDVNAIIFITIAIIGLASAGYVLSRRYRKQK